MTDYLGPILERKRREVARRRSHRGPWLDGAPPLAAHRTPFARERLRRVSGQLPHVIAEIKLRSPSAGTIRTRTPGCVAELARQYAGGGAAAVSVLCDGPGFGGSPLDLRRAAQSVELPLLFKEFVLHPIQVQLARALGAQLVLLLVRALEGDALAELVEVTLAAGMEPLVEAADEAELERALGTRARLIGVNARDLRTFRVDPERAQKAVATIPGDRIAVHMSGVAQPNDLRRIADSRADAVLIGEALMRASDPGARLRAFLDASAR